MMVDEHPPIPTHGIDWLSRFVDVDDVDVFGASSSPKPNDCCKMDGLIAAQNPAKVSCLPSDV